MLANAGCGRADSYFGRAWIPAFARDLAVAPDGGIDGLDFNRDYLNAVLAEGRSGSAIFGLPVMFDTLDDLSVRLDRLFPGLGSTPQRLERAFGKPLYIHLSRKDKLAQAISLHKATGAGLWHRAADGSELERSAPHRDAVYDAATIGALAADLSAQDNNWDLWFANNQIAPVRLQYETFSLDPRVGLRAFLAALRWDTSRADTVAVPTAKLADDESRHWANCSARRACRAASASRRGSGTTRRNFVSHHCT